MWFYFVCDFQWVPKKNMALSMVLGQWQSSKQVLPQHGSTLIILVLFRKKGKTGVANTVHYQKDSQLSKMLKILVLVRSWKGMLLSNLHFESRQWSISYFFTSNEGFIEIGFFKFRSNGKLVLANFATEASFHFFPSHRRSCWCTAFSPSLCFHCFPNAAEK